MVVGVTGEAPVLRHFIKQHMAACRDPRGNTIDRNTTPYSSSSSFPSSSSASEHILLLLLLLLLLLPCR